MANQKWAHPETDLKEIRAHLARSRFVPNAGWTTDRLVSSARLCDCLWDHLPRDGGGIPTGLIVIAGRTGSAKSITARGLIYKLLTDEDVHRAWTKSKPNRRPHLITLEDPIECPLFRDDDDPFTAAALDRQDQRRIDYTARNRNEQDWSSLEQAMSDALRQTPLALYVGEVRSEDDWRAILEFAGTGHLAITTTHAGSVTEAWAKIVDAVRAREPEALGRIAQKILAVVHQAPLEVNAADGGTSCTALIPTMWRQTPAGIAAIISQGLSAVLPHYPQPDNRAERASLGRRWFVDRLLNPTHERDGDSSVPDMTKEQLAAFDGRAWTMDLRGM